MSPAPEAVNPKLETRDPKPETRNSKPETRDPKLKILLIEDNPGDARLIEEMLKETGLAFTLECVASLSSGIDKVRLDGFNIILLDLGLPDSQGLGTLTKVLKAKPEAPVIVLTGLADEDIGTQAVKEGAQDYLIKGQIDHKLLSRSITHAVERAKLESSVNEQTKRFETFFDSSITPLAFLDRNFNFIRVNTAYANAGKRDISEFPGHNHFEFYPSDAKTIFEEVVRTRKAFQTFARPFIFADHPEWGATYWNWTLVPILDNNGEVEFLAFSLVDVTVQKKAEQEREVLLRWKEGVNLLQQSLLVPATQEQKLKSITDGIVRIFDADFCRIWRIRPGDLCEQDCVHAEVREGPHVCRDRDRCLQLLASSGRYIHTDGKVHRRVPFGCYKIGQMASGDDPKFLTNDVQNDPRVHNHAWARDLGLVSFAGYQLRVPGGQPIGVLALFAKHPISVDEDSMLDGLSSTVALVTQQAVAEAELRKSEQFVKSILSSVDEAFVVIDRDYRILTANRAYCEQTGRPLAEIIGKHCYEISHHVTRPCHELERECACKHTLETGEPAVSVHSHMDDKGASHQVEVKTYAMKDESGKVASIIEIVNDITEKTALENQLRHAQKMEGIGTLAGGIAHDFNNILSAIIGYGHITLMKMPKNEPLRLNIEHMLESADRAASLTQSLLTFSRKQIIDRKPVDLNTILSKVEKFLVRVIGEDVEVRMTLLESALTIFADAGQLEQVFMNLATNARDAMPNGGLFTIETALTELDNSFVTAHGYGKQGTYAMISASDTGAGMSEETRKKIFEPFFTTKEVGKGTGLGLAMVYGIIKQHEGLINVYSEPGKGTTFRIYLPLIKAAAAQGRKAIEPEYPKGGAETILLAEDDPSLRKLTVLVLEEMGYTVITANDGEEAVTKFTENKGRIQLLLFDVMMPKKSGKEAYEEIRKAAPEVPVLFASGYSADMLHEKSLIEKDAALVYKPVSPQTLLKKVREMLDRKLS